MKCQQQLIVKHYYKCIKTATDQDFGFLTVKLTSRDKRNMFMVKFDSYIEFDEMQ